MTSGHRGPPNIVQLILSLNFRFKTSAATSTSTPIYKANTTDIATKKRCGVAFTSDTAQTAVISIAIVTKKCYACQIKAPCRLVHENSNGR